MTTNHLQAAIFWGASAHTLVVDSQDPGGSPDRQIRLLARARRHGEVLAPGPPDSTNPGSWYSGKWDPVMALGTNDDDEHWLESKRRYLIDIFPIDRSYMLQYRKVRQHLRQQSNYSIAGIL